MSKFNYTNPYGPQCFFEKGIEDPQVNPHSPPNEVQKVEKVVSGLSFVTQAKYVSLCDEDEDDDAVSQFSYHSQNNLIAKRKSALKRASQAIKDYNFKHNALLEL